MVKLDIGPGLYPLPDYTPIEIKDGKDGRKLDYADGTVDEVHASHVLEHLGSRDAIEALMEWVRVLKPGGVLRVAVPDLDKIVDTVAAGNPNGWPIQGYLYGGQSDEHDFHRSGYNEGWLSHLMQQAGLVDVKPWEVPAEHQRDGYCAALPVSLNIQGTKPATAPPCTKPFPFHRKIAAVMSMPRLAFADNMFCALQALTPLRIPFEKVTGAFWGPCLTRVMEPHLDDGTDWILTLDYDTVFSVEQVKALAVLMEENPHADAIAPIQFKRDEDTHLFRPIDEATGEYRTGTMSLDEFNANPLLRVGWAHFGLTMIRTSALRKLKRPWFHAQPDPEGRWGNERMDEDIYFWNNFRACGLKLYVATQVTVGHLQLMATWAGKDMEPVHQYASDYHRSGMPREARR